MSKISDVIQVLEEIAPIHYQETYDNAGLITGSMDWDVKGVLCALDTTEDVVKEAIRHDCNLIVAHHPIVFSGLKQITGANYIQRTIIRAIKNDIAIYAIHTNLDNVLSGGVNGRIAERLGLQDTRVLLPKHTDQDQVGAGVIGLLTAPIDETDFLTLVKTTFNASVIRHTRLLAKPVVKVAACGGSGRFLLPQAIAAGADVFISADFKYHEFFDADDRIWIADVGHFESEQYTIDLLKDIISQKFRKFATRLTEIHTNPVHYF